MNCSEICGFYFAAEEVKPRKFVGCYKDELYEYLHLGSSNGTDTPNYCTALCHFKGFSFAAIQR